MDRKCTIVAAIALLLCFGMVGAVLAEQAKPFRIGCAVSLTGRFGKDGTLVRDAYTLWMEKVNAKGGINGHPVEIIFYDDKSDAPTAAKLRALRSGRETGLPANQRRSEFQQALRTGFQVLLLNPGQGN